MKVHAVRGGGGLRLHVREWRKADGPPILFIHGWSQTISAGRSSTKVRSPTNFDSLPMTSVVTACPRDRSTSHRGAGASSAGSGTICAHFVKWTCHRSTQDGGEFARRPGHTDMPLTARQRL